MDEKDFELLLLLYAEKNITKTSEKLYISQPALTYKIKKLEKELGIPIIIRSKKGVVFTPQGEKLIYHVKKIKVNMQNMRDDICAAGKDIQGILRLGISSIYAHYELPYLLKGFLDKYPKVEVSIQANQSSRILKLLQSDKVSAGIIRGDYNWADEKVVLSVEPLCLAYNKKISFQALCDIPYIKYETDPNLQFQIDQWWNERYMFEPNVGITTDSIDTCLELVKVGLGWSILPYMGLKSYNGYTEKLYWNDGTPFTRKTSIFYKKEYLNLLPLQKFIEYAQNSCASKLQL